MRWWRWRASCPTTTIRAGTRWAPCCGRRWCWAPMPSRREAPHDRAPRRARKSWTSRLMWAASRRSPASTGCSSCRPMRARSACRQARRPRMPRRPARCYRYPDGDAPELRRAIGARFGLDPARIVCGAGSDDLIYQLCLAYGGHGRDIIMTRAWLCDLRDRRHVCRQPGDQGGGAQSDGRCGRHAGGGLAGDAAGVPGQPEQPDRQHAAV